MDSVRILKTEISLTEIEEVSDVLINGSKISVAICNANTLVRSYKDEIICNTINSFSIRCPDGFPVAKSSRLLYKNKQKRVDGYKLFLNTIQEGIESNTSHYFFGNTQEVTKKMIDEIIKIHPKVNIKGFACPPMHEVNELSKMKYVEDILKLNPDIVWVSLGFPKQEQFIDLINKKYDINSNMVGIGAVFEWVAKTKIKAPELIANVGLEWLFRLVQEPKRLFRRYLIDNFLFIIYFIKQYLSK
jgi:N-acetylglucosaminyldiphosphoundecaprenol N-acetyl-beta-D-mannosaminyltransferase